MQIMVPFCGCFLRCLIFFHFDLSWDQMELLGRWYAMTLNPFARSCQDYRTSLFEILVQIICYLPFGLLGSNLIDLVHMGRGCAVL